MKPMTYADWRAGVRFEGFSKGCTLLGLDPLDMDDLSAPRESRIVGFAIYPGDAWIGMLADGGYSLDCGGDQLVTQTLDKASLHLYVEHVAPEVFDSSHWTLADLTALLIDFRVMHRLSESSADELLAAACKTPREHRPHDECRQVTFLLWFVKVWEAAEDREAAA